MRKTFQLCPKLPAFIISIWYTFFMKLGKYQHYKGKFYKVLGIVKHSETLYDNSLDKLWVRPLSMFEEEIEIDGKNVKRFKFIE